MGPDIQLKRFPMFIRNAPRSSSDSGMAYYCFCDEERLAKLRVAQEGSDSSDQGYDRRCRALAPAEAAARVAAGEKAVIRLKIPLEGTTRFHDLVLGDIEWKNEDVSPDPVLLKSDGFPTYHLANIVDDHLMRITHVMRAQEWIPSAPFHIVMYDAFGWEPPQSSTFPWSSGRTATSYPSVMGPPRWTSSARMATFPKHLSTTCRT